MKYLTKEEALQKLKEGKILRNSTNGYYKYNPETLGISVCTSHDDKLTYWNRFVGSVDDFLQQKDLIEHQEITSPKAYQALLDGASVVDEYSNLLKILDNKLHFWSIASLKWKLPFTGTNIIDVSERKLKLY